MKVASIWILLIAIGCSYTLANDAQLSNNSTENEVVIPAADANGGSAYLPSENTGFDTSSAWNDEANATATRQSVVPAARTNFTTSKQKKKSAGPAGSNGVYLWAGAIIAVGGLGVVIVGVALVRGRKHSRRAWSVTRQDSMGRGRRPRSAATAVLAAQLVQAHTNAETPTVPMNREATPLRRVA